MILRLMRLAVAGTIADESLKEDGDDASEDNDDSEE